MSPESSAAPEPPAALESAELAARYGRTPAAAKRIPRPASPPRGAKTRRRGGALGPPPRRSKAHPPIRHRDRTRVRRRLQRLVGLGRPARRTRTVRDRRHRTHGCERQRYRGDMALHRPTGHRRVVRRSRPQLDLRDSRVGGCRCAAVIRTIPLDYPNRAHHREGRNRVDLSLLAHLGWTIRTPPTDGGFIRNRSVRAGSFR